MIEKAVSKPVQLSAEKNVVRYVGGSQFDSNTGKVDADGLSFTEVGVLARNRQADEAQIRTVCGSRIKLGATACFAELNVGAALKALEEFEEEFSFVVDPLPAYGTALENPAHALLLGLPFKGEAIGSLRSELAGDLLAKKVLRTFPAVAPK